MKIIKARYDLVFFFFFPFCLIVTLLYVFFFQQIANFSGGNWLCSILILFLFFWPPSKGYSNLRSNLLDFKWILSLFLSQLLMNLTIWSFAKILSLDPSNTVNIKVNITSLSLTAGLFPWGFMILLAITLLYLIYKQKKLGLLSSAYEPLFHNTHLDSIGIAVDSYMRFISLLILILGLTLLAMAVIFLLHQWTGLPLITGLNFSIFFSSCLLLLIVSHQKTLKFLHHILYRNVPVALILISVGLLIGVLYLLFNLFGNLLIAINPLLDESFYQTSLRYKPENITIVITFCWYGLSALNAGYIAFISQDKTLRQLIVFSLVTFVLSLLITTWLDTFYEVANTNDTWPLITMIGCAIVIITLILNKHWSTYFLRATLPTGTPIKTRSNFRLLKIVPLAIVSFLCVYFGLGVTVWSFLLALGLLPPVMVIYISFFSLIKEQG